MSSVMRPFLVVVVVLVLFPGNEALKIGFYKRSCPNVEALVAQAVGAGFANNPGIAPGLVRMHFHDCFVRGCDGSVLLDGNNTEKTSIPNLSLRGFEVIDAAKAAIEAACPRTVSCADILAFAARDSSNLAGNIVYKVPAGRRDGNVSIDSEALSELPPPSFNAAQLVDRFANKTLTADEMVTLSGAHSFGVSHCFSFTNRIYNFSNPSQTDPNLSLAYANLLRNTCPSNSGPNDNVTVFMDLLTPTKLDNKYYLGVLNNLGLFESDHALVINATLRAAVVNNSRRPNGWATKFKRAMVKMGAISVLEGTQGEIRANCRVVNGPSFVYNPLAENGAQDEEAKVAAV